MIAFAPSAADPDVAIWSRQTQHGGSGSILRNVRKVIPWIAAAVVLVALWPALCMSQEGGPTTCQSAVFLPLPWGESADTWGWFAAIAGAAITFVVLRLLLRDGAASKQ
jgi:hypothetical protein